MTSNPYLSAWLRCHKLVPVEPGEYVSAGTTIAMVADTARPFVDVFVPQARIAEFDVGRKVDVSVDSLEQPLGGRVEYVSPSTEFTPRFLFSPEERPNLVVRVRVRIRDTERLLRSGIPAFIDLEPSLGGARYPVLSASASAAPAPPPGASAIPATSASAAPSGASRSAAPAGSE